MKYSVVVPIYNDGALARDFCLELRRVFSAYLHTDKIAAQLELIFVDDGSRNDSARKLKDLCDELDFVKAVVLSRNFGHHTAVAAGYRAAQGDYVAMLNVDQEDPIRFLPAMLDRIAQGDVDIVGCLRRPPYRVKFTSAWFHRVMNRLTGYTVPQNAGTLRVLTKRATATFAGLAEHNQYFPGLEMWLGLQYAWIETEHEERRAGRSSYNFRKRLRMAIASVISFSDFPLRYAVKIGMSIAGIGAALDWAAARKADWLVTSPCDTPLLPGDLIARLHAAAEGQADLAFARTADGDHPLAAIWSVALAPRIGALLHDGVHPPLHTLVEDLRGVHVWFADAAAFLNINTPEDLARARALLAR